jgi:GntR family negative regulator for fad regulon and positive regulator of fabA
VGKPNGPVRPAVYVEETLVRRFLNGTYPPGTVLPSERELAAALGVTRPTLREALQRLARDGWITIRHGKQTRVNDFWKRGGLRVLSSIVRYGEKLPPGFVRQLLEVREVMAPAYTRAAVEREPEQVVALLADHQALPDTPEAFASFDWKVQHRLTELSGNPIYSLILNGFEDFYERIARIYFEPEEARRASRAYYVALLEAASNHDGEAAEEVTRKTMRLSVELWEKVSSGKEGAK